jgi:hypothetical protein
MGERHGRPESPADNEVASTLFQIGSGYARAGSPTGRADLGPKNGRAVMVGYGIALLVVGLGILGGYLWAPSARHSTLLVHLGIGGGIGCCADLFLGGFLALLIGAFQKTDRPQST